MVPIARGLSRVGPLGSNVGHMRCSRPRLATTEATARAGSGFAAGITGASSAALLFGVCVLEAIRAYIIYIDVHTHIIHTQCLYTYIHVHKHRRTRHRSCVRMAPSSTTLAA